MNIGAVIIGDEILSGKRQDKHFSHIQEVLAQRGLELSWTVIVGDEPDQLERFLRFTMATDDLVFSFGGIGATPDDRTRQTAARVAGVELLPHQEAIAEIEAKFGKSTNPKRLLMAELPVGSRIIPNPVNRVPGFSFNHHHFMPGFPEMSWPMLEWVLDSLYPELKDLAPASEQTIYITNSRETDLLDIMTKIVTDYPQLKLSSLPRLGNTPCIELSLRGNHLDVEQAMTELQSTINALGITWTSQPIVNQ
ncbi:MAG: competence/damage-inducible protein A [Proteobacteria bacterium]|nr:competence/damage-inducible protein A [Pseudomonadota bacterium]